MGGGVVGVVGVGVVGVGVAKSACFAFADPCDKRLVLPEQVRFVISLVVTDKKYGTFWLVVVYRYLDTNIKKTFGVSLSLFSYCIVIVITYTCRREIMED
jgi:hypothetical protein